MNRATGGCKADRLVAFEGRTLPNMCGNGARRARFFRAVAVAAAKTCFGKLGCWNSQAHCRRSGGARQACHAGGTLSTGFIGAPQHGQGRGAAGLGAGG